MVEEIAKINDDTTHQETVIAKKVLRRGSLFKDSEFAVIDNRKKFKYGMYWQERFGENNVPKYPALLSEIISVKFFKKKRPGGRLDNPQKLAIYLFTITVLLIVLFTASYACTVTLCGPLVILRAFQL